MTKDLEEALNKLRLEILLLHKRVEVYRDLFGTNKEFLELLNNSSGTFFYLVQTGFLENIIISISRLVDPPNSNGYKNLSLNGVINLIEDKTLKKELTLQSKWYLSIATEFLKNWRRKKVAHLDLNVALSKVELQNEINLQNLDIAIKSIREFYNTIHLHYFGSKVVFGLTQNTTTKPLLISLKQAKTFREYIHEKRKNGSEIPEELEIDISQFDIKRELNM